MKPNKLLLICVVGVLFLVLAGTTVYFALKYQRAQKMLKDPSFGAREAVESLISQVGRLMVLPSGETPTVATVSDKRQLANQPFFANSEVGDKVLFYPQARKAILFRPSLGKIIEVSTVNMGDSSEASPSANLASYRVAIYNGSRTVGLAAKAEKLFNEKLPSLKVVAKGNTVNNYPNSFYVVINPEAKVAAAQLSSFIRGEVAPLPSAETKPDADLLLILGEDFLP